MNALRSGNLDHFSFGRSIDHVEEVAGTEILLADGQRIAISAHPDGSGVNDDVKLHLLEQRAVDGLGSGLLGQPLRRSGGAIEDVHFRSAFFESKDGGPSGAPGT